MRFFKVFIVLVLFTSCSSKQNTIEQYLTYPVKFPKKEIKEPNGNYSIFIPKDWENKFETESEVEIFQAISVVEEQGSFSTISVFETKPLTSESKDLKSQYDFALQKYKTSNYKLLNSGTTDIFGRNSYYIQAEAGNAEFLDFFVESEKEDLLYLINISSTNDENKKHNMSIMLNCLKTFKITQN